MKTAVWTPALIAASLSVACGGSVSPVGAADSGVDSGLAHADSGEGPGVDSASGPGADSGEVMVDSSLPVSPVADSGGAPMEGGGDGGLGSCMGSSSTPCGACVTSKCSSSLSQLESDCASFVACACACPPNESGCESGCEGDITPICMTAIQSIESCETSSCESACGEAPMDAGGPTPDGGAVNCNALQACCAELPAADQGSCEQLVTTGNQMACGEALGAYTDAGLCH
jgi:hypothetical protein